MSFNFILDLIVMVSLGTILLLLARALPRVSDEESEPQLRTPLMLVYLEKADKHVKMFSEKFLRRSRVVIMKLDNRLSERLSSFKKDSDKNGGLSLGFEESEEEREEVEE